MKHPIIFFLFMFLTTLFCSAQDAKKPGARPSEKTGEPGLIKSKCFLHLVVSIPQRKEKESIRILASSDAVNINWISYNR